MQMEPRDPTPGCPKIYFRRRKQNWQKRQCDKKKKKKKIGCYNNHMGAVTVLILEVTHLFFYISEGQWSKMS